jgi:hypothetical protein
MSKELSAKETQKVTATMPVSVTLTGNVEEPKDVADRRNGLRNLHLGN